MKFWDNFYATAENKKELTLINKQLFSNEKSIIAVRKSLM